MLLLFQLDVPGSRHCPGACGGAGQRRVAVVVVLSRASLAFCNKCCLGANLTMRDLTPARLYGFVAVQKMV